MKAIEFRRFGATLIAVGGGVFAYVVAVTALAQGAPVDWSHRHVIYSNPDTEEEAAAKGKLDEWGRNANDPRFILQLERKEAKAAAKPTIAHGEGAAAETNSTAGARLTALSKKALAATWPQVPGWANVNGKKPAPTWPEIHRDWSNVMGGAQGAGDTRTYPAKFAFGITAKDCANDFVVFTTSAAGATSAGTTYLTTGTFTGIPVAGQPVSITNVLYTPDQVLTLTADASVNTGLKFAVGASASEAATNLANAIARNGGVIGVTASAAAGVVTVTSITTNIANGNITPADGLSNFAWGAETAGSGTKGQPTIFALNQLYADTVGNDGCQTATQAVPAVYWSYNTGAGAVADLSPVLSFYDNGAQVAFMQRSASNVSSLVLLKWSSSAPGTLGAPTAPTSVTPANYRACTAPCMTVIPLSGNPNNTNSSPYVDYTGDALYVGDDTGKLHRFTGVFQGTPAEVVVAGTWPAQVAATTSIMSSPVFDGTSTVYIGSNGPNAATGNRLHRVDTATGAVTSSGAIGSSSSRNGVRDAPILDTTAGKVYAFQGAFTPATTDSLGLSCGGTCNTVFQFATGFAAGNTGSSVFVGLSGTNNNLQRAMNAGAFDDEYYSSGGQTGNLYVCGSRGNAARRPTLWKISILGGSFAAVTLGPLLVSGDTTDACSPPTVFKNGSTENLYVSVNNQAAALGGGGCTQTAGCLYMYTLAPSLVTAFDTTSASSTTNAADRFLSVSTSLPLNATEGSVDTSLDATNAGTYQGMTITQSVQTPAATTNTYTLRNNNASTPITCSILAGSTTCSDTSHVAGTAPGVFIDVLVQRTPTGTDTTATFRVQLTVDRGWNEQTLVDAALNATGGTGGIIIDNTLSGGGSQVYFSTRGAGTTPLGIAVQATQAGLN